MAAVRLILHGKVQGVFYRDWTVSTARDFGLTGWVRNLPDDTVEAWLEGDGTAIDRMIAAMQDGPIRARVDNIDREHVEAEGFGSFDRR